MRKLKDLIYDYNDILLALVIIAIAALIIFWRVTGIMAYEGERVAEVSQTEIDFSDVDLEQTGGEDYNTDPEDLELEGGEESGEDAGSETGTQTGSETEQKKEEDAGTETGSSEKVTTSDITITIPSGYYSQRIAKLFVEKGLVSDAETFLAEVEAQKADTKLKAGTFKIPAGSTLSDMVKIISK